MKISATLASTIRAKIPNPKSQIPNFSMDLPPTQKGRHHELRGLGLREFAGLTRGDQRLDPFELARYAGLLVVTFDQIESLLTEETLKELVGSGKDNWSGGAASKKLPNGKKVICHLSKELASAPPELPDDSVVMLELSPFDLDRARIATVFH